MKLFVDPTVVLVSMRCDEAVMERLDPGQRDGTLSADERNATRLPYLLESRPSADFAYEAARNKLMSLHIGEDDGPRVTFLIPGDVVNHEHSHLTADASLAGGQGQLLRLSGWIDFDSRVTVGCAGSVLAYLQRRRTSAYLPGHQGSSAMFRIATVAMFTLDGYMYVLSFGRMLQEHRHGTKHIQVHQRGHAVIAPDHPIRITPKHTVSRPCRIRAFRV